MLRRTCSVAVFAAAFLSACVHAPEAQQAAAPAGHMQMSPEAMKAHMDAMMASHHAAKPASCAAAISPLRPRQSRSASTAPA